MTTFANRGATAAMLALLALAGGARSAQASAPPPAAPGGDIPETFNPAAEADDYIRRDVMIPMRDGARLHTVLIIPKGATHAPIILDRTPYGATRFTTRNPTAHRGSLMNPSFSELSDAGYIIVAQDIRGRYKSDGDYVMNRPLVGALNPTAVDHSTDTWDTIDWLVKNTPESNGKVATMGTSYDGFTALMSLVHPHPALKAAVPFNPMVDGWMGDDWFHNGAFREANLEYIYRQTSSKMSDNDWTAPHYDDYDNWMAPGGVALIGRAHGMDALPFWTRITQHPAYDAFWSDQAVDRILAAQPLSVPTLLVHSQWDQEDSYGAQAVWAAIKPKDAAGDKAFMVIGPWRHGGGNGDGSSLGAIKFDGDTGRWFRANVLRPFLDAHLVDGAPAAGIAPVTAFETGANQWRRYDRWPQSCTAGCPYASKPLYLAAGARLSFDPPSARGPAFDDYVSDPARPVTYRAAPLRPYSAKDSTWGRWLVDDQRFAGERSDVLTYTSEVLSAPVRIAGQPVAHLFASTTGTDSDWVVKLIDVYPDEVAGDAEMGGYQLAVSMDILRGRYRDDPAHPSAIPAGKVVAYALKLPNADHVFLPGHRIMVQVQSSWFPLYDRNPQTFVDNIFFARPADYVKATQKVFHTPGQASFIDLPVAP